MAYTDFVPYSLNSRPYTRGKCNISYSAARDGQIGKRAVTVQNRGMGTTLASIDYKSKKNMR